VDQIVIYLDQLKKKKVRLMNKKTSVTW